MSILNRYKEWGLKVKLLFDKYLDFVLTIDNTPSVDIDGKLETECLSVYIDLNNENCISGKTIISLEEYNYEGASNESGCTLNDIGLTGIDNGLISFEKDRITNKEYLDILTGSTLEIGPQDYTLKLNPVTGNTMMYTYDYDIVDDEKEGKYIALKGGFLQGFYKLYGFDYEVLPSTVDTEWNLEFVLRPKDYEERYDTLNNTHNNKGYFFYMGTRAENKFAQFYETDLSKYETREYPNKIIEMCNDEYTEDEEKSNNTETNNNFFKWLFSFKSTTFPNYSNCSCSKDESKEKIDETTEVKIETNCDNFYGDDYFDFDTSLDDIQIVTSEGNSFDTTKTFEIETDNKFITYNRTKTGKTTTDQDPDETIILTGKTKTYADNPFLLFNRTKTGYTANERDLIYQDASGNSYDLESDYKNNCFGLKINENGGIEYHSLVSKCVSGETVITEISGKTYDNLVKKDEWSVITVKFKTNNNKNTSGCTVYSSVKGTIKMYIYINGFLKFVSKDMPNFNFTNLDESYEKQEGVPYSISLGGGTQGLCDSIWLDYNKPFEKILPIEEHFAGTFIGDIKSFKFYTCGLQYNQIKNNYLFESNK